jgi:uncharacterized membrane protein YfhO
MSHIFNVRGILKKYTTYNNENQRRAQFFMFYTYIFIFLCIVAFCWYVADRTTFISTGEGWEQYYKAMVYYSNYLKTFFRNIIISHKFVLPEWDFSIGEGSDILQTLHYCVIGDPLVFFCVLIPIKYMWIFYTLIGILRLYFSGIAFSHLCFYTIKKVGRVAVMAGAFSYAFCAWAFTITTYYYYANVLLYFPLVILGIEKIVRGDKSSLLPIAVALLSVSNFGFFYITIIISAVYVVVRLIVEYKKNILLLIKKLMKLLGCFIWGTTISAIILLPVIYNVFLTFKESSNSTWLLWYPLSYYSSLASTAVSFDGKLGLYMGFSAPVILAVLLLLIKKKSNYTLKILLLLSAVAIVLPAFGKIANLFSSANNIWCWSLALLAAYSLTVMWPDLMKLNIKEAILLSVFASLYFGMLMLFEYSRSLQSLACFCFTLVFIFVIFPYQIEDSKSEHIFKAYKEIVAFLVVFISIATINFFRVSSSRNKVVYSYDAENYLMETEAKFVEETAESENVSEYYRYTGQALTSNSGFLYGISSTQYDWKSINASVSDFRSELQVTESGATASDYVGYDERTSLLALNSTLYYIYPSTSKNCIPYGYELVETFEENELLSMQDKDGLVYNVYHNKYALPLTYTYDTILSEKAYKALNPVEKQEAMLQSVVLSDYDGETQDDELTLSSKILDYDIECDSEDVSLQDYGIVVTKENASIKFNFDEVSNSEIYFNINGIQFEGSSEYDLYFGDDKFDPLNQFDKVSWYLKSYSDKENISKNNLFWQTPEKVKLNLKISGSPSKSFYYYTENNENYSDNHDYTVNLCYSKDSVNSITMTFTETGIYTYDSIEIIAQPMDNYNEQVSALKETTLHNQKIGTDTVTGTISLDESKVLCFSIPYSSGWSAYVDGRQTTLYQANTKNMAIILDAGEHDIKLIYHTPYLRIGAIISFIAIIPLILVIIYSNKNRKNKLPVDKCSD